MYGQVILHRRPDPVSKVAEVSFHLGREMATGRAACRNHPIAGKGLRHQQWVCAESVKAVHRPTLLDR